MVFGFVWLSVPVLANSFSFATPSPVLTSAGYSVEVSGLFEMANGQLSITLNNNLPDDTNDEQEIVGISFNVNQGSSTLGADPLIDFSVQAQQISLLSKTGSGYTTPAAAPSNQTAWSVSIPVLSSTSSTFDIGETGPKSDMIIGPPDTTNPSEYAGNHSSIYEHNPQYYESATFILTDPNLSAADNISNIQLLFGTQTSPSILSITSAVTQQQAAGVPEPATLALLGAGLTFIGWLGRSRAARTK